MISQKSIKIKKDSGTTENRQKIIFVLNEWCSYCAQNIPATQFNDCLHRRNLGSFTQFISSTQQCHSFLCRIICYWIFFFCTLEAAEWLGLARAHGHPGLVLPVEGAGVCARQYLRDGVFFMECFEKKYAPFKGYDFGKTGIPIVKHGLFCRAFVQRKTLSNGGTHWNGDRPPCDHTPYPPFQRRKTQLIGVNAVIGSSNARWCDGGKSKKNGCCPPCVCAKGIAPPRKISGNRSTMTPVQ